MSTTQTITKVSTILAAGVVVLLVASAAYGGPGRAFSDADFKAELSGDEEVPPVETDTTGEAKFIVDETDDGTQIDFELEVADATDILAAAGAHIHCAPEGENGPIVAFLAGQVPGGFDGDFEVKATLTDDNVDGEAGCGDTIDALLAEMEAGNTYVNVHSAANPGGEVRGQIESD